MDIVIRMRTISRALLFIGSGLLWLILLTILNATVLRTEETYVVVGAVLAGGIQAAILALILKI